MAQAEEETRSRGAIVIKHGGRYQGKKVTVRAPAPALASLTKPKHSSPSLLSNIKRGSSMSKLKKGACASNRRNLGDVQERSLSERVKHLLALRPYKRPELILRLQKDGLSAGDKDILDSVLMEVIFFFLFHPDKCNLHSCLTLYKDLQKDWPGYTSGDQQLLKRILVRRLFQPQQNLLTVPEAQVSPLRDTPNSSPAHRPKHSLPEEYTDPLASKKPRISHLSSRTPNDKSRLRPSKQAAHKDVIEARVDDGKKNSLDPRKLFDSLSAVCQQEEEVAKRLEPTPCAQEEPESPENNPQPNSDHLPSPLIVPNLSKHTTKRKKSKHKHRDQVSTAGWEVSPTSFRFLTQHTWILLNSLLSLHRTYTVICNHDQRQSYKQDFNKEYNEYRDLHARIDGVTRQFMELDTQLKQLHQESHKYKKVHNQILQEYRKIKKSNPNYNQDKMRCEYLHNKLAHIKKLISEYDQQQLSVDHSCAK
uniref:OCEL domain-containing protein n=1 Tax=Lates calcarifer TaxID=8187 RepID=A0A4W6E6R8_LATCA